MITTELEVLRMKWVKPLDLPQFDSIPTDMCSRQHARNQRNVL